MRKGLIPAVVLLVAACSSSSAELSKRPEGVPRPDVEVRVGQLFFGSSTTAPLPMDVAVLNGGKETISVRRIMVESPSMMQYAIYPYERIYNQPIESGASEVFSLTPTAQTSRARSQPNEPLNLRVWIDFQSGDNHWREMYTLR